MDFSKLHRGAQELLISGVDVASWAFRDLIGQQREWTPTHLHREVSASANVNPLDDVILIDCSASAVTAYLETAVGCSGRQHTFKKTDSSANAMILDGDGSETIDGTASVRFIVQNAALTLKSDGVNWKRVAYENPGGRYTPTVTKGSNVDTASAFQCVFINFGGTAIVAGRVNVDAVSSDSVATSITMSLPVPSDLAVQNDLCGVAFCRDVQQGAVLRAETTTNTAQLQYLSNNASDQPFFFIYMYSLL